MTSTTAESGVVSPARQEQAPITLSSWILLNWEFVLYGLIFLAAIFTRFYDLGARAISHDESLHMLYSYKLFAGEGYRHDPMMHGPFLFHVNALLYFLFGDNDYVARCGIASFGVVLVMLPYWLRPWLGRLGALLASVFILFSPAITHYSRHLRHDIYVIVFALVMVTAMFQFLRASREHDEPKRWRWFLLGAAAVSLMLSTMEVAFIHGFIGVTFILLILPAERTDARTRFPLFPIAAAILIVVCAVALWLAVGNAPPQPTDGSAGLARQVVLALAGPATTASGEADAVPTDQTAIVWQIIQLIVLAAGLLFAATTALLAVSPRRPVRAPARMDAPEGGLWEAVKSVPLERLSTAIILAVAIFVVLYTTFFTNLYGLVSGTWGGVSYWLTQHGVQRGSQPWYYYLMLLPMYEFLPLLVGLAGGIWFVAGRLRASGREPGSGTAGEDESNEGFDPTVHYFPAFLVYWAICAVFIFSWAGEKMPWLTVHQTLPLILLAAWATDKMLARVDWREVWDRGGAIFAALLLLTGAGLIALLTVLPFQGLSLTNLRDTGQWLGILVILAVVIFGLVRYWRRLGSLLAWRIVGALAVVILATFTARSSWLVSFVNYDNVSEYLFYAHGAPDLTVAMNQIEDLSRRTVGDKLIKVAYDNDSTWPFEWYFREYPNRAYYGDSPSREQLDAPIVIVGATNESKVTPFLGDKYERFNYRLVWWPLEAYKGQTPASIWHTYVAPELGEGVDVESAWTQVDQKRKELWDILFYHRHTTPKNEWPYVHRFYMYVRKDVLNQLWDYQVGPVAVQESVEAYSDGFQEIRADRAIGNKGSGAGQFVTPRSVAVGPDGLWYVADSGNNRVQVLGQDGNSILTWGSAGSDEGQFQEPWGIAVGADRVYVSDTWNHRVQVFDLTGAFIAQWGRFSDTQGDAEKDPGAFWGPRDIAIDQDGNVYVCDTGNKRIQKFTADGTFVDMWGGAGIIPGSFEEPTSIAFGPDGSIFVADTWNQRVQKFSPDFEPILQWDIQSWESESVVNKPYLRVDQKGNVYVGDPEKYRILVFDSDGNFLLTFGQYGFDTASFALPLGMAFDASGNLIVADSDNNRLLKFAPVIE